MGLIDKILGRKTLEITRNPSGTFEVSITGGYEIDNQKIESLKGELDKLGSYDPRSYYRIKISH